MTILTSLSTILLNFSHLIQGLCTHSVCHSSMKQSYYKLDFSIRRYCNVTSLVKLDSYSSFHFVIVCITEQHLFSIFTENHWKYWKNVPWYPWNWGFSICHSAMEQFTDLSFEYVFSIFLYFDLHAFLRINFANNLSK